MRRRILLALVLLSLVPSISNAEPPKQFDIRKARWGMSEREVFQSEDWQFTVIEGQRVYEGKIFGMQSMLNYQFESGKLVRVAYGFTDRSDLHFGLIIAKLVSKYGMPDASNESSRMWVKDKRTLIHLARSDETMILSYNDKEDLDRKKKRKQTDDSDF